MTFPRRSRTVSILLLPIHLLLVQALLILPALLSPAAALQRETPSAAYLGFDRNDYPGDENLSALRSSFAFTGFWLSNPPGERSNSWHGKRAVVERAGFGFLLLFNGRAYSELKSSPKSSASSRLGESDGAAAARAALSEGFPRESVIFLDQEEGGRMLPEQKQYVFAWAEAVRRDGFRPGVYCSGIQVAEPDGTRISTASDLHESPQGRRLVFWVANDACPPAPGCTLPRNPMAPEASGAPFAEVWQFAQSPVRRQFAAACRKSYSPDGNCYPPGVPAASMLHLDVNTSRQSDPSHARR